VIVAIIILGLYGVFGPVQIAEAGYGTDQSCMYALKQRGVPYEERAARCRIRVVATESATASTTNGYMRWRVGNELWRFWVEVTWKPMMTSPTTFRWRIDEVNCWKSYVYIVGLDISTCRKWWVGDIHYGGATYVTSFGPVSVGARTYVTVRENGAMDGPFYD
jgi:hypothetical protein